ncbi:carboxypeptidase-like regulatory domain-containing protein [Brevundimonas sp. UBA7664]|uniref:carboxypeptidase-like regulatory domain-containing protein n=1 Tax=Brevundimonas sp. UBA7664 TaxID=1946141 RepID=UPI0025C2A8D2|nr:hypothetical protein [Brevundimonas sp. UBA7664]
MSELRISFPEPCGESWDAMQPSGCDRICATCSETVHDLAQLTVQEAEALLREPGKHCVRALVGPDGAVSLQLGPSGRSRRMLVAVSASVGLFASACETVPSATAPTGAIVGTVGRYSMVTSVRAVSDDGRERRTRVRADGSYRLERLPYGTYSLKFIGSCGTWDGEQVALRENEHSVEAPADLPECIIIGMAKVEDDRA